MMRGLAVFITFVMLAMMLPTPAGAEQVDAVLIEDGTGDTVISTYDGSTNQPDSSGVYYNVDLTGAGILAEDDDSITFFVDVRDLNPSSDSPVPGSDPRYEIYFNYRDQQYRVRVDVILDSPGNQAFGRDTGAFGRLEKAFDEGRFRRVQDVEVTAEALFPDNRVTVTIPREPVRDHNEAPLGINQTLSKFWVEARALGWFNFPVGQFQGGGDPLAYVGVPKVSDRAPNKAPEGELPEYEMTTGPLKQRGALKAVAMDPVRWTNGEATTLTYQVEVWNNDAKSLPVKVSVRGAKPEWTVAFSDAVTVPHHDSIIVTFLVTIPFTHSHGNLHMFEGVFEAEGGSDFAAADMGVYWPAVPQPAGHHDTLWFHSMVDEETEFWNFYRQQLPDVHAWISAAEQEDHDQQLPIRSLFTAPPNHFTNFEGVAYWRMALEPPLRMGLDFRPEEMGTASITIDYPLPAVDPRLHFTLKRVEGELTRQGWTGEEMVLAQATPIEQTGAISGTQVYDLELDINDEADLIPYSTDATMLLEVVVRATWMTGVGFVNEDDVAPTILPGPSFIQLPLNEYHDPSDLSFKTDGTLALMVGPEGQERKVNPGKVVIYTFNVQYTGKEATTFRTQLSGLNAEWTHMVGDHEFTLQPNEQRRIGMAVMAPKGASNGERADVTLTVISAQNAAIQAGINTVTIVTTSEDIADEAPRMHDLDAELTTNKDSPGVALVFLLAGLVGIAIRRRK